MRSLGCLVIALVVLGGVLFFADQAVTSSAENQTAHRVAQAVDAETEVDFDGWPVSVRMLLGSIPTARITATDVPMDGGAKLAQLEVELTDVEVNLDSLQGGDTEPRLPPARRGTFSAELDEESVAGLLRLPEGIADVALVNGGITISAAGIEVETDVEARDGDVVVSLSGPLAELLGGVEFPIDLSEQPGAPFVEDVEISDGVMTVSGTLEDV